MMLNYREKYVFVIMFMFSILNMLYMHYQFLFSYGLEFYFSKTSVLDNFLAVLLDVTVIFLFFLLLFLGRVKTSLLATFVFTLIFSFCNIVYSRFFGQYLTFTAIGQAGNLNDNVVIKSVLAEIRVYDILHILFILLFAWVFAICRKKSILTKVFLRLLGGLWAVVLVLILVSHSIYLIRGSFARSMQTLFPSYSDSSVYFQIENVFPNWVTFHKGLFRTVLVDHLHDWFFEFELGAEEYQTIKKEYLNHEGRVTNKTINEDIQNVIFIIAESYLSVLSDLKVDGKEITPYLNALKRDSNVYYNGHVIPNATIGRSSDGQLIYMTGILPLRSEVTVGLAKNDSLVGLPDLLLKQGLVKHTQIMVPTSPSLWEQNTMNKVYNIETMYSKFDYRKNQTGDDLEDEEIFEYAKQLDATMPSNSFSLLLSLSMHEPYDDYIEHGFYLEDNSLPIRYKNYLITSHYFDEQIGKYIEHLKANGLYDKSLIVIASDHEPLLHNMDIEGKVSKELVLYIINGGFDKDKAWMGVCNQLDVYTTLLDIMGIDSEWRGLGHTLLNPNYSNSVSDETWQISEWIIKGDYFRREKNK